MIPYYDFVKWCVLLEDFGFLGHLLVFLALDIKITPADANEVIGRPGFSMLNELPICRAHDHTSITSADLNQLPTEFPAAKESRHCSIYEVFELLQRSGIRGAD